MIIIRNFGKFSLEHLTPLQVAVTQRKSTEPPFTSEFNQSKEDGVYKCVVCEVKLFESGEKFDSKSGWPSFYKAISGSLREEVDSSYGMVRTEVVCRNCGSHLGHFFEDGPKKSRFCINGCALSFSALKIKT